jgi:hypothetical protein
MLESKAEARAKGHPSPDRADAVALSWANHSVEMPEVKPKPATLTNEDISRIGPMNFFRQVMSHIRTRKDSPNFSSSNDLYKQEHYLENKKTTKQH